MALSSIYDEFADWVKQHKRKGSRFGDSSRSDWFVAFTDLASFWNEDRLGRVSDAASINRPLDTIRDSYLQVLSILTYLYVLANMAKPSDSDYWQYTGLSPLSFLERFIGAGEGDSKLPITSSDDKFGGNDQVLQRFLQAQHHFKHASLRPGFLSDRSLSSLEILPMTYVETISSNKGRGTVLQKYKLDPCHDLHEKPLDGIIVVKEFPEDEVEHTYKNECNVFTALKRYSSDYRQDKSSYFLKCYGTLKQARRAAILLEYANGGSLLDLFQKNNLPNSEEEFHCLWLAVAHLLFGLSNLHDLARDGSRVRGIHQDIKPSNIFVLHDKEKDPYTRTLRLKLGDFDMSTIRQDGDRIRDNKSTKVYGAPELMDVEHNLDHQSQDITSDVDMWSIGCVIYETAIWSILGGRGLRKFEQSRRGETTPYQHQAGYAVCFHNGSRVLNAVAHAKDDALRCRRVFDTFTEQIMKYVTKNLLLPGSAAKSRSHAANAHKRIIDIIEAPPNGPTRPQLMISMFPQPTDELTVTSPTQPPAQYTPLSPPITDDRSFMGSPQPRAPTAPIPSGRSPLSMYPSLAIRSSQPPRATRFPSVNVDRVLQWKSSRNRAGDSEMTEFINAVKGQLGGRDQIFVIDNSSTMQAHWLALSNTLHALGAIVKSFDPDGMELRFTSNPSQPYRCKNTTELLAHVQRHRPGRVDYNMERTLAPIISTVARKAGAPVEAARGRLPDFMTKRQQGLSGVSLYILTDGIWDERGLSSDDDKRCCGVDALISQFIEDLQNLKLDRTYASIQFVGFGDDPVGWTRLQHLDDNLRRVAPRGWDIVDAKPHDSPLYPILIGSLDPTQDG